MKLNWLVKIFLILVTVSPQLKQYVWRWIYNKIALKDQLGNFIFMNYGYTDENDANLVLSAQETSLRYFIQLYARVVKDINLNDKQVIEVGCGRGGGGAFLLRYKNLRSYIGFDLAPTAIEWCQRQYPFINAKWTQAPAHCLNMRDESVDVVINVESSHCYPSMKKFLSEVVRVLRPQGHMCFCDLRPQEEIAQLEAEFLAANLSITVKNDITLQVLKALDCISLRRNAQIEAVFPAILRPAIRDFAAVKNTAIYTMLQTGKIKYLYFLLQKPLTTTNH